MRENERHLENITIENIDDTLEKLINELSISLKQTSLLILIDELQVIQSRFKAHELPEFLTPIVISFL